MTRTILLAILYLLAGRGVSEAAFPITAASPDGGVRIEFALRNMPDADNVPHYRVVFGNVEVVAPSRLGMELEGGSSLGGSCEIVAVESRMIRDVFTQISGKRRNVVGHATVLPCLLDSQTVYCNTEPEPPSREASSISAKAS